MRTFYVHTNTYMCDVYMYCIFSVISLFNGLKNVCIFSGFFFGFLYIRVSKSPCNIIIQNNEYTSLT